MTMFPSKCQVYRVREGHRWVVFVFGYASGCIATGDTIEEAEEKAERWVRANLERKGLIGKIGILDLELAKLCAVLKLS